MPAAECPVGTFHGTGYLPKTNPATPCTQCSPGYYQDETGQTDCKKCEGDSDITPLGATSKSDCRDGSKCYFHLARQRALPNDIVITSDIRVLNYYVSYTIYLMFWI